MSASAVFMSPCMETHKNDINSKLMQLKYFIDFNNYVAHH